MCVDIVDETGYTAFAFAVNWGHVAIAEILLEHGGVNVDATFSCDGGEYSPLGWALTDIDDERDRVAMVSLLLRFHANSKEKH